MRRGIEWYVVALVIVLLVIVASISYLLLSLPIGVAPTKQLPSATIENYATSTSTNIIDNVQKSYITINASSDLQKLLGILKERKSLLDEANAILSVLGAPYIPTTIAPLRIDMLVALPVGLSASTGYGAEQAQVPVSRTNVQVEGVDEPDIVKNSDRFIAVAVGEKIYIIDATSNRVASILNQSSTVSFLTGKPLHVYAQGMLLYNNKLVIIARPSRVVTPELRISALLLRSMSIPLESPQTLIIVVDVSDIYSPRPLKIINVSGLYVDARLGNGYAYIVTSSPVYSPGGEPVIPLVNGVYTNIFIVDRVPEVYTTIVALDLQNLEYKAYSYASSSATRIYLSRGGNLYIASPTPRYEQVLNISRAMLEIATNLLPSNVSAKIRELMMSNSLSKAVTELFNYIASLDYENATRIAKAVTNALKEMNASVVDESRFYVYKVNGLDIVFRGVFKVSGSLLDQFCMEEMGSNLFIVATTERRASIGIDVVKPPTIISEQGTLTIIICNAGECKSIYLQAPRAENVSRMLLLFPHLVFEESSNNVYIINVSSMSITSSLKGLAKGERIFAARLIRNVFFLVTARVVDPLYAIDVSDPRNPKILGFLKMPGFSEYLHPLYEDRLLGIGAETGKLKISLFNVSDPTKMSEIAVIKISDAWSPALSDYHAVTVYPEKRLVVIPLNTWWLRQGFLVVNYTRNSLDLYHFIDQENPLRAVYIGNKLYTISQSRVLVIDIDSRSVEAEIKLE